MEVVIRGHKHNGPTTVYKADFFFVYKSFPAAMELLIQKICTTKLIK